MVVVPPFVCPLGVAFDLRSCVASLGCGVCGAAVEGVVVQWLSLDNVFLRLGMATDDCDIGVRVAGFGCWIADGVEAARLACRLFTIGLLELLSLIVVVGVLGIAFDYRPLLLLLLLLFLSLFQPLLKRRRRLS